MPRRAKTVYMYLKDRCNQERQCYPAIGTIARELHLSRRTVERAIVDLIQAGLPVWWRMVYAIMAYAVKGRFEENLKAEKKQKNNATIYLYLCHYYVCILSLSIFIFS